MRSLLGLASLMLVLATSGCGSSAGSSSGSSSAPATAVSQAAHTESSSSRAAAAAPRAQTLRVLLRVRASHYGRIVVDAGGRTLYLFTRDPVDVSRCVGACAAGWPPYTVRRRGTAGGGAAASLLGLTRRADGRQQVTYRGHPLYYYIGDRLPGQILCQDVEEYGGHWWLVSPAGAPVTGSAPPCGTTKR